MIELERIRHSVAPHGLALRGGFHPGKEDAVPALAGDRVCRTVLLIGNLGGAMWACFSRSPEYADGGAHPLDRWTRRILEAAADSVAALALFPFGGPPWLPFQRWALKAEEVSVSPLGILIHPDFGLWHAYRGALALAENLDLPKPHRQASPCDSCANRPCLSACPVGAFQPAGYDVASCRDHVASARGESCRDGGCMARLACPVGREHGYPKGQMAFHMAAFMLDRRKP
jgi:ferredoxin